MSICCVLGCDVQDSDDTIYFTFPVKPTLRKKWRAVIPTARKLHDDSKVCAQHFKGTDYEWVRGKLRLKSGVVPCVFARGETQTAAEPKADPDTGQPGHPVPSAGSPRPAELPAEPCPAPPPAAQDFAALADLDESAENCTIECVPEAVLNHDSDSHSETELQKEDIENIIANYHIKQNKELADRLKASEELDREKQKEYLLNKDKENSESNLGSKNGEKGLPNGGNFTGINPGKIPGNCGKSPGKFSNSGRFSDIVARIRSRSRSARSSQDSDCVLTEEPRPQFVEISVDKGGKDPGDCMMLLESVQVDVDPTALLHEYHPLIAEEPSKAEAISLLTSSDSDDVILQEPHIDTVEVSSSDSESRPLVRLVSEKARRLYPCLQCQFTTYSRSQYQKHRLAHRPLPAPHACACGASAGSAGALRRHQRSHRARGCADEALVLHVQARAQQTVHIPDGCMVIENVNKSKARKRLKRKRYKCDKCPFVAARRRDLREHVDELH